MLTSSLQSYAKKMSAMVNTAVVHMDLDQPAQTLAVEVQEKVSEVTGLTPSEALAMPMQDIVNRVDRKAISNQGPQSQESLHEIQSFGSGDRQGHSILIHGIFRNPRGKMWNGS